MPGMAKATVSISSHLPIMTAPGIWGSGRYGYSVLEADSALENTHARARRASSRTAQLYDRTGDAFMVGEVERIAI